MTNSLNFLPQVDNLVLIEEGKITDNGAFNELIEKTGPFSVFYQTFLSIRDATVETTSIFCLKIHINSL